MVAPARERKTASWIKWARVAALGVASLAVIGSAPVALGDSAHFRGGSPQGHAVLTQSQAHALAHAHYYQHSHGVQRRLDANSTLTAATDKAASIGKSVRKAIKQMRGGTDKFYHDLITAVKIQLCEQLIKKASSTNPKNRFVDSSDKLAYKDSNGNCIKVQATDKTVLAEYSQGHCEVKPNCYWAEIESTDTDRKPVYSITEAAQPADDAMSLQQSKDTVMKWAQGLMVFVVPGIILAVLSLLTMILFLLCRCCCNRCGGRSPKEGGYTCMQKFYPLLFFLLFGVGVVAVAGASMLYQKTVTTAVSDVFQAGVDTLDKATAWIVDIETPLENIAGKVTSSANDIKTQLAGTDFIETGLDGLTGQLTDFGSYSANRRLPNGCTASANEPYCIACDVCTTISTEVTKATTQIQTNAGDGVKQLNDVRTNLNSKLVDISSSVQNTVDEQVNTLSTLTTTITDAKDKVTDIQSQYEKQKQAQKFGVLAPFVLAIVVVVIGFVGVLFGLTPLKFLANIIHIAYILGFLALVITFILSSIFLAVSVVLGDVCEVTAIFTDDWTVALGDEAKGINACFQNASLIDTFNLSSSLDFARGGVQFPDLNVNDMLNFNDLDTFATSIQAVTASTFAFPGNKGPTNLLSTLDTYVSQTSACAPGDGSKYTAANIDEPWTATGGTRTPSTQTPEEYVEDRYKSYDSACDKGTTGINYDCPASNSNCKFSEYVAYLYHNTRMAYQVQTDSGTFVTELHANMTKVTDYTTEFKNNITAFDGKITAIRTDLEGSLIKYVDDFENAMYCTFISDGYFDIYNALCGDLMPAFTMISLMVFLAGVFLIPVNICLIIALKRLKARGNGGHVMDNEMKFK